jgi:arginine/ornithine transport system ATP-binding protein
MTPTSPTPFALVDIRGLHKSFGATEVLKGIDLQVGRKEVVCIIGKSGSGKSTLLRCLNLLERPHEGRFSLGDETLAFKRLRDGSLGAADAAQLRHWRTRLAFVFQSFNLWQHRTALENITEAPIHVLGQPRAQAVARGRELLARVGLSAREAMYPAQLSGGEQQRVAIARALAVDPAVMLFDEPTSALDPELVGEVLKVMRGLAGEGRTMLVVTHEMEFAREVASQVVFLHQGLIEEQGAPREVLARPQSARLQQFLAGGLK